MYSKTCCTRHNPAESLPLGKFSLKLLSYEAISSAEIQHMALTKPHRWALWAPKPVKAKGTAKAFAAGDAIHRKTGVNQILKNAIKASIKNDLGHVR